MGTPAGETEASRLLSFQQTSWLYGRVLILLWCFTHLGGIMNFWLFD